MIIINTLNKAIKDTKKIIDDLDDQLCETISWFMSSLFGIAAYFEETINNLIHENNIFNSIGHRRIVRLL